MFDQTKLLFACCAMLCMFFFSSSLFSATGIYARNESLLGNAEIAKKYGLHGDGVTALELCQNLIPREGRLAGDIGIYCGCVTKHAGDEFYPGYKHTAIRFVAELRRQGSSITEHSLNNLLPNEAVRGGRAGTARMVLNTMSHCGEEAIKEGARLKGALRAKQALAKP
jgi:hypothetical protein